MSVDADDDLIDYELSYNVDDIEMDLLYEDEGSDDCGNKSFKSKCENGCKESTDNVSRKPDRPLFRPRQLWSRGRGRGFSRGMTRRGNYHRSESKRSIDSRKRDRSRSEEDLRARLSSSSKERRTRSRERSCVARNTGSKDSELNSRECDSKDSNVEPKRNSCSKDRDVTSKSKGSDLKSKEHLLGNTEEKAKFIDERTKSLNESKNYCKNSGNNTSDLKKDNRRSRSKETHFRYSYRRSSQEYYSRSRNRRSRSKESNSRSRRSRTKEIGSRNRSRSREINSENGDRRSKSQSKVSKNRSSQETFGIRYSDTSAENIFKSIDRISRDQEVDSLIKDQRSRSRESRRCRSRDSDFNNKEINSRSLENVSQKCTKGVRSKIAGSNNNKRSKSKENDLKENVRYSSRDSYTWTRSRRSKSRNTGSQTRRSKSMEKESKNSKLDSKNRRRSISHERRSRSKERRSKRSMSRKRSRSRGRMRSRSRTRHSLSRGRCSRSKGRRSVSRDRHSRSKGRRSFSRSRRSRSRDRHSRSRRSRSRGRRSRSRGRRSRSRERCISRNRSRGRNRKSDSKSSSRSPNHSRRRRTYSRSGSNSSSSDVIVYKPRVELIDVDMYEENRDRRVIAPHFGEQLLPTVGFSTVRQTHSTPFLPQQFNQAQPPPPPPGIGPFESIPGMEPVPGIEPVPILDHEYSPGQPPPAPFISSHLSSGSQQFGGPPPPPQIFTNQPQPSHLHGPSVLRQRPLSPGQFHNILPDQPKEFGGFHPNKPSDFIPVYPGPSHQERFLPPFNAIQQQSSQDLGISTCPLWNAPPQKQQSTLLTYDPDTSASSKARTISKKSGVEEERQNQKQTLVIQRDQYLQKSSQLQKELKRLKDQRAELTQDDQLETEVLLKENTKQQNEITQRLKAVENVIEMLTGLIKSNQPQDKKYSDSSVSRKESSRKGSPSHPHRPSERKRSCEDDRSRDCTKRSRDNDPGSPRKVRSPFRRNSPSPHSHSQDKSVDDDAVVVVDPSPPPLLLTNYITCDRSLSKQKPTDIVPEVIKPIEIPSTEKSYLVTAQNQVNLVHYDPELHWCSLCNVFPKTAVDYLSHLHTPKHEKKISTLKIDASPWHSDEPVEPQPPFIKNAPTKRIPIRGVQFLVPTTGWYCRLCKAWNGDMHCAQEHLKGRKHTTNYAEYIAQNPHWEVDWLSDRTKSFERSSEYLSRLREKEESPTPNPSSEFESEKAKFSALSDTLLAVLAQQNKRSRQTSSSSSTTSSEDDGRKKQKKNKKKKYKKKKRKDPTPEKISPNKVLDKVHIAHYRQTSKNYNETAQKSDAMISCWMDSDKLVPPIAIKLKNKFEENYDKTHDIQQPIESNKTGMAYKEDKSRERDKQSDRQRETDKLSDKYTDKSREGDKTSYKIGERTREAEKFGARQSDKGKEGTKSSDRYSDRSREGDKLSDRYCDRNRDGDKHSDRNKDGSKTLEKSKQETKGSGSRWGVTRDPLNFIRKDSKDIKVTRLTKDQKDERPMAKKVELAKKKLGEQRFEEMDLKPLKKKSPVKVFQRPDSDEDSEPEEIPEKKDKFSKNDKPQGKLWFPNSNKDEEEKDKTLFEKQTGEETITKKKIEIKKPSLFTLPKVKLPFIGRMPILKKKTIEFKSEEPKEKKSKLVEKTLTWPNIPNAVEGPLPNPKSLVDKPSNDDSNTKCAIDCEKVSTTVESKAKFTEDNLAEQDMEIAIDDQDDVILVEEESSSEKQPDLHPDFQDALELLFPEPSVEVKESLMNEKNQTDQSMLYRSGFNDHFEGNVFVSEIPSSTGFIDSCGPGFGGSVPPIIDSSDPRNCRTVFGSLPVVSQDGPPSMGPPPIGPQSCLPIGPQVCPPPIGPQICSSIGSQACPTVGPPMGPNLGNDVPVLVRPPPIGPHVIAPSPIGPPGPPPGPPPLSARIVPSLNLGPMGPMGPHGGPLLEPRGPIRPPIYSEIEESDKEPPPKRKNAPSQRMRRHMQKKRAEEAKAVRSSSDSMKKKSKYEGMDLSDLAMLGIDEDDTIIS